MEKFDWVIQLVLVIIVLVFTYFLGIAGFCGATIGAYSFERLSKQIAWYFALLIGMSLGVFTFYLIPFIFLTILDGR